MATPAEDREEEEAISSTELTAEIVAAYVGKNTVAIADIGPLIDVVGQQLRTLGQPAAEPPPARPEPAMPVRRSVHQDHLVCLVCGKRQKVLRRHLNVAHRLTPDAYRELVRAEARLPYGRAELFAAALRDGPALRPRPESAAAATAAEGAGEPLT